LSISACFVARACGSWAPAMDCMACVISDMDCCRISMCRRATACAPSSATLLAADRASKLRRWAAASASTSGIPGMRKSASIFIMSASGRLF
jgi:hypothetical protein